MRRDKAIKYMKLTMYQADLFSKDPRTKVGCCILAQESLQVLSLGYNGFPRGIQDTDKRWERPTKYFYVEHAERNAIYNASRKGTPLENSILVVTKFPCHDCSRAIIQSGIKKIITFSPNLENEKWGESFKISLEMFQECGMELIILNPEELSCQDPPKNI